MLRRFAIIPLILLSSRAHGLVAVTTHGGAAFSQLGQASGSALAGTGFSYGASLTWQPESKQKLSFFSLGLAAQESRLQYSQNSIQRRATYTSFGPQLGLFKSISETVGLQMLAQYSPLAQMTSLSTNTVALNGETFRYSTWESFKGTAAVGGRLAFIHDKTNGQFSKKNRFRSGVGLSYSTQTFTQWETRVSTSRDALTPSTTSTTESISQTFSLISLDLFVGLSF